MTSPNAEHVKQAVLTLNAAKNHGHPDVIARITKPQAEALVAERQVLRARVKAHISWTVGLRDALATGGVLDQSALDDMNKMLAKSLEALGE